MKLIIFAATLAAVSVSTPAYACGGFFCSQQPVLQTAERLVFEVEDDQVTAYVQLEFSGSDPSFAWIVPVPSVPEVEVGVGTEMFDALEAQTRPVFRNAAVDAKAQIVPGGCGGSGVSAPPITLRSVPPPDVQIARQEKVGPYEYVVLSADSADDLNDWLDVNGYRSVPGSEPIVQEYLDEGMQLLALKLAPSADATSVEPIRLSYQDSRGCAAIPIRLTAIAAQPGLEIVAWVFGDRRAAAENFDNVAVDFSDVVDSASYERALDAAVDASDGQGFVTEYAGASAALTPRTSATLGGLIQRHGYVTRLRTRIDPDQMTTDPEFNEATDDADVSNIIDLAQLNSATPTGLLLLALLGWTLVRRRR